MLLMVLLKRYLTAPNEHFFVGQIVIFHIKYLLDIRRFLIEKTELFNRKQYNDV